MEQRLREILRGLGYTDDEVHLQSSRGGRVTGYRLGGVSGREPDQPPEPALGRARASPELSPEELSQVSAILTMTPAEAAS